MVFELLGAATVGSKAALGAKGVGFVKTGLLQTTADGLSAKTFALSAGSHTDASALASLATANGSTTTAVASPIAWLDHSAFEGAVSSVYCSLHDNLGGAFGWLQSHLPHLPGPDTSGGARAALKQAPIPLVVAAGSTAALRWLGFFVPEEQEADPDEEPGTMEAHKRTFLRHLPSALMVTAFSDIFVATTLVTSWPALVVPSPLHIWAAGSLLLSFPATRLVSLVANRSDVRTAFSAETCLSAASFAWLTYGTYVLSSPSIVSQAAHHPLLYWICLTHTGASWVVITLSVNTVLTLTIISVVFTN
eukprot:TRINITY_DN14759_c0_g2_i4.p1 TRINITY_DN14759_c0_g2~~TRINITY_DN14759_c0_g2_i4.p1  ORF type:complete len:306 (-),score=31.64 TRINITY_DN14759_c0_g2_i4:486-1403(-)